MKYAIIFLLFGGFAQAQWGGVVTGTSHKTATGKYPYFFDDQGHPEVWDDSMQKDYDQKMSATLKKLCGDNVELGQLEKDYVAADQKDSGLNSHPEIGNKIQSVKADIIKLSDIVVRGTGQSARVWGCQ